MTANLGTLRTALATTLRTVIRASYDVEPEALDTPCVIVSSLSGSYDQTFDGTLTRYVAEVLLLAGDSRLEASERELDKYLAPAGLDSLRGAIVADPTLGGAVSMANVRGFHDAGLIDRGNVKFIGAVLDVDIYAE